MRNTGSKNKVECRSCTLCFRKSVGLERRSGKSSRANGSHYNDAILLRRMHSLDYERSRLRSYSQIS